MFQNCIYLLSYRFGERGERKLNFSLNKRIHEDKIAIGDCKMGFQDELVDPDRLVTVIASYRILSHVSIES